MSIKGEAAQNKNAWAIFDNLKLVEKMSKDELIEECKQWRDLWTWIPQEMQGWLSQIGQEVIVVTRNYRNIHGHYAGFTMEIVDHKVRAYERIRDEVNKVFNIVKTDVLLPKSNIVDFKFVKGTYEDTKDPNM